MISRIDLINNNKPMIIIDYFDIFDVDDDAWFCDKTFNFERNLYLNSTH